MKNQSQRLLCSFVSAQVIRFSVTLALTLVLMLCAQFVGGRAFGQTQPATGEHTARPNNTNYDDLKAMTLQPDGKIIVAGLTRGKSTNPGAASGNGSYGKKTPRDSKGDFALTRYLSDGRPDTSFGEGGKVVTDFAGNDDDVEAVALQADGKILLIGTTKWDNCDSDFALARYNSDGTLDASFGRGGKVVTDFFGKTDRPFGGAIQPDGRIVVAGNVGGVRPNLALARYTQQGGLDPTFGDGGKVVTPSALFPFAHSIRLGHDGKILVAGGSIQCFPDCDAVSSFTLIRYHNDGRLDTAFGDKGAQTTPLKPPAGLPKAVVFQPDGKAILVSHPVLLRFNENGLPDSSFGSNGVARAQLGNGIIGLLPEDGFLLAHGSSAFSFARYGRNGELDLSFGTRGTVIAPRGGNGTPTAIALQPDGKIIMGGLGEISDHDFRLMRYNGDGTLDPAFGSGGKISSDFNGITDKTPALDFKQNPQAVARKQNCPEVIVSSTISAIYAPPRPQTGTGGGLGSGGGMGVGPGKAGNLGGGSTSTQLARGASTTVDSKPVLLSNPPPHYTEEARKNKIQGTVTARVLVGADGQVKQVRIVRGLPDGLDEHAIQAAYLYRYKAALKDNKPVAYWVVVKIEFNLR